MTHVAICALFCSLALSPPLTAQAERWQVATDDDKYVWDVQLVRLDGNALVVNQSDSLVRVPVKHISEIRLIQKTEVDMGAGAAGAMPALVGAGDEIHDISTLDLPDRLGAIKKILADHPASP